jgi:hypothetical protein
VIRSFKIPAFGLLVAVSALVLGELASGTPLQFASMMAVAMLSIALTYNLLGGLSTMSGIAFTAFAMRTIVISQFAKVLLFEAADKNLEAPELTISVYALFYFSALVGVYAFGHIRLRLPRPMEPSTRAQGNVLYWISFAVGFVATVVFESYSVPYGDQTVYSSQRNVALAFTPLLMFSLVIATENRIESTGSRRSFGVLAALPWISGTVLAFFDTNRTSFLAPSILYFLTCYLKGYRFRPKHYLAILVGMAAFSQYIGPLESFTREFIVNKNLENRIHSSITILMELHTPRELREAAGQSFESGDPREQYFSRQGTYLISRVSLIRADSNIVSTCASGFHYGFEGVRLDLLESIPSFLLKQKPRHAEGQDYIGHVIGMSSDDTTDTAPQESAVGDSYGAFGWIGVVLFPLLCFPALFVVYESIFDFNRPWGIVAFLAFFLQFGEMMVGRFLPLIVRYPILFLLLSYALGTLANMIPMVGDRASILGKSPRIVVGS